MRSVTFLEHRFLLQLEQKKFEKFVGVAEIGLIQVGIFFVCISVIAFFTFNINIVYASHNLSYFGTFLKFYQLPMAELSGTNVRTVYDLKNKFNLYIRLTHFIFYHFLFSHPLNISVQTICEEEKNRKQICRGLILDYIRFKK